MYNVKTIVLSHTIGPLTDFYRLSLDELMDLIGVNGGQAVWNESGGDVTRYFRKGEKRDDVWIKLNHHR